MRTLRLSAAALVVGATLLVGCSDGEPAAERTSTTAPAPGGPITVSAAASLTESFTEIGRAFSDAHAGIEVDVNFDGSSALAAQIIEGAPADVFASADEANMTRLTDEDLVDGTPEQFARNELVIVTKPGNPASISSLADLAEAGVISLCGAEVPCGRFAQQALDGAGVTVPETSVTRAQNVKAALTAVSEGDAVAGVVYVTDAVAAGDAVDTVEIPAGQNVVASYPIGVLRGAADVELARAFERFVLGDEGQAILERFGFLPPA